MRTSLFLVLILFLSCNSKLTENQLTTINGYWEIEKVILADGFEKEYKMGAMVDYFMLDGMTGYRKKVQPLFDGTFDTSDDAQAFEIEKSGNKFELHYKNDLSEWTETILNLNESILILTNQENVKYHYKRVEPLKLAVE